MNAREVGEILSGVDADMERPGDWESLSLAEREKHPHQIFVNYLQTAYMRQCADDIVRSALNPLPPMRIVSQTEVLEREAPGWIVPGFIQESGITEFAGPSGIAKTFFMIGVANSVATGTPFFSRPVIQGRVLYVVGEGAASFGNRLRAWMHATGVTVPDGAVDFVEEGVNISDAESVDRLASWIEGHQYKLIILDTFSQLSGVENENDAAGTAKFFRNVKKLRDANPGSSVVVVHHMNATGTKARGSTVHKDNVDVLAIARGKSSGFSVSTLGEHGAKIKDGVEEEWHGFKLQPTLDSAVIVNDGKKAAPVSEHWLPVVDVLQDGLQHPSAELYAACGITGSADRGYKAWSRVVKGWVDDGLIVKHGTTKNVTYSMPPMPGPMPDEPISNELLVTT